MMLEYCTFTHKGHVRKTNQDYFFVPETMHSLQRVLIVADGMGGHNAGDIASKIAVESAVDYFTLNIVDEKHNIKKAINEAIQYANSAILKMAKTHDKYRDMGTTFTIAYVQNDKAYIGHVGDSRAYIIKNGEVIQVTRDHSLVQELFENGTITKEQMNLHPNRNILTNALGLEDSTQVDLYEIDFNEEDVLLLCTDGLNLYVDLAHYEKMFQPEYSLEEIVNTLGQKALNAGGSDNVTIVAARNVGAFE